jgi:competence protein ComEA
VDASGPESISIPALRREVEAAVADENRASLPLADGERIDPNFADAIELRRLPGIGPSKAAAIVEDRRTNGPFESIQDLERVAGLGPTTVARLSAHLNLAHGYREVRRRPTRIDLNTAQVDELETLPGIGPELARRIVDFRATRGKFRAADDLLEVPGIGPATMEKIRNRVRIR